jgi:hypothetical protein
MNLIKTGWETNAHEGDVYIVGNDIYMKINQYDNTFPSTYSMSWAKLDTNKAHFTDPQLTQLKSEVDGLRLETVLLTSKLALIQQDIDLLKSKVTHTPTEETTKYRKIEL